MKTINELIAEAMKDPRKAEALKKAKERRLTGVGMRVVAAYEFACKRRHYRQGTGDI